MSSGTERTGPFNGPGWQVDSPTPRYSPTKTRLIPLIFSGVYSKTRISTESIKLVIQTVGFSVSPTIGGGQFYINGFGTAIFTDFSGNHPSPEVQLNLKDSTTQLRALQGVSTRLESTIGTFGPMAQWFYMETCVFFFAFLMSILFLTRDHIDIPVNVVLVLKLDWKKTFWFCCASSSWLWSAPCSRTAFRLSRWHHFSVHFYSCDANM